MKNIGDSQTWTKRCKQTRRIARVGNRRVRCMARNLAEEYIDRSRMHEKWARGLDASERQKVGRKTTRGNLWWVELSEIVIRTKSRLNVSKFDCRQPESEVSGNRKYSLGRLKLSIDRKTRPIDRYTINSSYMFEQISHGDQATKNDEQST